VGAQSRCRCTWVGALVDLGCSVGVHAIIPFPSGKSLGVAYPPSTAPRPVPVDLHQRPVPDRGKHFLPSATKYVGSASQPLPTRARCGVGPTSRAGPVKLFQKSHVGQRNCHSPGKSAIGFCRTCWRSLAYAQYCGVQPRPAADPRTACAADRDPTVLSEGFLHRGGASSGPWHRPMIRSAGTRDVVGSRPPSAVGRTPCMADWRSRPRPKPDGPGSALPSIHERGDALRERDAGVVRTAEDV